MFAVIHKLKNREQRKVNQGFLVVSYYDLNPASARTHSAQTLAGSGYEVLSAFKTLRS